MELFSIRRKQLIIGFIGTAKCDKYHEEKAKDESKAAIIQERATYRFQCLARASL